MLVIRYRQPLMSSGRVMTPFSAVSLLALVLLLPR
jgi:hypothetical protein